MSVKEAPDQQRHRSGDTGCWTNEYVPDNKVHGANMEPVWGRQDPGGPDVGPMNFVIWGRPQD